MESQHTGDRPDPEWVRGRCPKCGEELVSNLYYTHGVGYRVKWECWASIKKPKSCDFSKVL